MQRVKTIEDAKALIGRTFERDGKQRKVDRITNLQYGCYSCVTGNVYWGRPGGKVREQSQWLPYFNDWLAKAEEAMNDA